MNSYIPVSEVFWARLLGAYMISTGHTALWLMDEQNRSVILEVDPWNRTISMVFSVIFASFHSSVSVLSSIRPHMSTDAVLWYHYSISVLLRYQPIGCFLKGLPGLKGQVYWRQVHQGVSIYPVYFFMLEMAVQPFLVIWFLCFKIGSFYQIGSLRWISGLQNRWFSWAHCLLCMK